MGALLCRLHRSEGGMGLLELALAGMVAAMIMAVMVVWAGTTIGTENHLGADDDAAQDLRIARENLSKELRKAEQIYVAETEAVEIWVDENRDGTVDAAERITWKITEAGELVRSTAGGSGRTDVRGLDTDASGFGYDASSPADIRNISFVLTLPLDGVTGADERSVDATVHIRNS